MNLFILLVTIYFFDNKKIIAKLFILKKIKIKIKQNKIVSWLQRIITPIK